MGFATNAISGQSLIPLPALLSRPSTRLPQCADGVGKDKGFDYARTKHPIARLSSAPSAGNWKAARAHTYLLPDGRD